MNAQSPDTDMQMFDEKMEQLEFEPFEDRLEPTEQHIARLETHFGNQLPADYRAFLSKYAGGSVSATCKLAEPSPCGDDATIERFYGFFPPEVGYLSLEYQSDTAEGAPVVIPIAEGAFGSQIFLFLQGELAGSVYFFDAENRYFWTDKKFYEMSPGLAPEIETFLDLRRRGDLDSKPEGLENFYRIAPSFTDFVSNCEYWDVFGEDEGE